MIFRKLLSFFLLTVFLFVLHASAESAEYPVSGEGSIYFENVFKMIDAGQCSGMGDALKVLEEKELVSGDIFKSICFFKISETETAVETLEKMVSEQAYDEVLFVVNREIEKGNGDIRLIKLRGLSYMYLGELEKAKTDFGRYFENTGDEKALYLLTDIYINSKETKAASSLLEKSSAKDGRYFYRKGRLALMNSQPVNALGYMEKIAVSDAEYGAAKMIIADICAASGRYKCAEEAYGEASKSEEYGEMAQNRRAGLSKKKKFFSGMVVLGGQYDTNVTSVDEDELPTATEESSFRGYAAADIKLNFYPGFAARLTVGTMNYASSNENYHDYDVSMHKVYVSLKKGWESFVLEPKVSAYVTYLGGEKYSTSVSGELNTKYPMEVWTLAFPLKVVKNNYMNDESSPDSSRDGYKYSAVFEASRLFAKDHKFTGKAGYAYDDVAGDDKVKNDTSIDLSVSKPTLREKLTTTVGIKFASYDYENTDREDDTTTAYLKTLYQINKNIFAGGGVTYTSNDSDVSIYNYTKTVVDVYVGYAF